jgi:hypothetical protein
MDCTEDDAFNNSSVVSCIFIAAVIFLMSLCLAMIGRYTYRHTDWWKGFMNYAVQMASCATMYIPGFIKSG